MPKGGTMAPSEERPASKDRSVPEGRWTKAGVIAAVLTLILTYLGLAFSNHWLPFQASPEPSRVVSPLTNSSTPDSGPANSIDHAATRLTASIREPTYGAMVPLCLPASGFVSHMPSNMALWLFIQIPDQNDRPARWYVIAKLRPGSGGRWSVPPFQVGDPGPGRPYWLEIFVSDISATGPITAADLGNDALASIPLVFDTRPLNTVLVHRENTSANETCA